jgi:hypothetical protein
MQMGCAAVAHMRATLDVICVSYQLLLETGAAALIYVWLWLWCQA